MSSSIVPLIIDVIINRPLFNVFQLNVPLIKYVIYNIPLFNSFNDPYLNSYTTVILTVFSDIKYFQLMGCLGNPVAMTSVYIFRPIVNLYHHISLPQMFFSFQMQGKLPEENKLRGSGVILR